MGIMAKDPQDASLGSLHVNLHLDDPRKKYYGSDDPVTGRVALRYERNWQKNSDAGQLFGPLEMDLTIKGFMNVIEANSSMAVTNAPKLCWKTTKLHTGPFRAAPQSTQEFPFEITFPEHADPQRKTSVSAYQDSEGQWRFRRQITNTTIEALPPSFESNERHTIARSEMWVRYALHLDVKMPGIEVNINNPTIDKVILYDRPRVPPVAATLQTSQTHTFTQIHKIQHRDLLAPNKRPQGFKSLFKATDLPTYAFNATCTGVPKQIFIGQPIELKLSLSTDQAQTTASMKPEIAVSSCIVSLIAHTKGIRSWLPSSDVEPAYHTEMIKEKECDVVFSSPSPYGKVGDIDVGTMSAVPSSFTHGELSREYKLRITMTFLVLGQTVTMKRTLGVTVNPPLLDLGDVGEEPLEQTTSLTGGMGAATPPPAYDAPAGVSVPSYFDSAREAQSETV